jgi:hypothetical protein
MAEHRELIFTEDLRDVRKAGRDDAAKLPSATTQVKWRYTEGYFC